jgi:hypothetical protein
MGLRRGLAGLAVAAAVLLPLAVVPGAVGAYTPPPVVDWTALLPGLPTVHNPQFTGITGCETPTMACIDWEIAQLDQVRRQFGCDHRAVFATTYELLTIQLKRTMLANPHVFDDPAWVIGEDVTFANLYLTAVRNDEQGKPVAPAWQVAFGNAAAGNDNAVQDMLLGINAHVQRDMPFMMAAVGLHTPDGKSRKHDHEALNAILNQAYQSVTDTITARFDPIEGVIAPASNPVLGYAGNVAGDQLVLVWREEVWRNAERLLDARTPTTLVGVERSIEDNAVTWAKGIAAIQIPGYRAIRDAYCATHNVGPLT